MASGDGCAYANYREVCRRVRHFAAAVQARVGPQTDVLDFGSGSGEIAAALCRAGFRVTGLDISPAMVERARARFKHEDRLSFSVLQQGYPPRVPQVNCSFDVVVCSSVLEYVPDPARFFVEFHRVLRPMAWLLATVPNPRHPVRLLETVALTVAKRLRLAGVNGKCRGRWDRWLQYLRLSVNRMPVAEWVTLAEDAGFEVIDVEAKSSRLPLLVARKPAGAGGRQQAAGCALQTGPVSQ